MRRNNAQGERNTFQKETILRILSGLKIHPSADLLFRIARKKIPNISKGTVYRVLNNYKKQGKIQEIPAAISRYDGDVFPHAHFICSSCSEIFDIFDECKSCGVLKRKKTKVGKINYYQMYFYGKCKKCQKRRKLLPRLRENHRG